MPGRKYTDEFEEEIARWYQEGKGERQLAKELQVSRNCIHGALGRQKTEFRSPGERNRLYQVDAHAFDVIDTEHKAYFLGLLYADGNVHKRTVKLSQKRQDRILVERLKKFLKSEHPIDEQMQLCKGKRYPQSRIMVTEGHLASRLKSLGILPGRPSHKSTVGAIPEPLRIHFIRGYFDGDGSAHTTPGLSFAGSEPFLEWIRAVLFSMGVSKEDATITKHTTAQIYYLYYSSKKQGVPVAKAMYKNATTGLERKRERTESW